MLYPHRARWIRSLLLVALALPACDVGETWETAMIDEMAGHAGFTRINARPYPSALGPPGLNLYCDPAWAGSYARIDPDQVGSHVRAPVDAQIVREVLDETGAVVKLTMMAKGPPGYDPSLGDWMFAVTDPDGVPLIEEGQVLSGRLAACHECHDQRAQDDFLFGVPRSVR